MRTRGARSSGSTRARRAAPFARVHGAQAREFYTKDVVEYFVAFLIVANFITNIMERWKDPVYSARGLVNCKEDEIEAGWCAKMRFQESVWWGFGLFYNIMFTGELVINYYAYAPWAFWTGSIESAIELWTDLLYRHSSSNSNTQ